MASANPNVSGKVHYYRQIDKSSDSRGKVVNGFLIKNIIGEGGYAEVFLGECLKGDKATPEPSDHWKPTQGLSYALKKMSKSKLSRIREYGMPQPQDFDDPNDNDSNNINNNNNNNNRLPSSSSNRSRMTTALDKVRREIEIMAFIKNQPNIINLYAVIDDPEDDSLYLILECAEAGQIMNWDGSSMRYKSLIWPETPLGGLPLEVIGIILFQLVQALQFLHSNRIIHRDIKPDNILVSLEGTENNGTIKLCDFGVARRFHPKESSTITETHGTYHFFAPEMCSGEKYDGFGADIWALGLTLFIMSFGSLPFVSTDNNPNELFENISKKKLQIPEKQKPEAKAITNTEQYKLLIDLIESLLCKDPNTRLSLEHILAHPFMKNISKSSKLVIPLPLKGKTSKNEVDAPAPRPIFGLNKQKKALDSDSDSDDD